MRSPRRVGSLVRHAAAVAVVAGVVAACQTPAEVPPDEVRGPSATSSSNAVDPGRTARVVAVGDVVCEPDMPVTDEECQYAATADLTSSLEPEVVVALGDLQYETGDIEDFKNGWATSWGRFDDIVTPVPGNHEYGTDAASGYTRYFDTGPYYERDIGAWRFYLLDSNCDHIDCEQEASWLSEDLASHPGTCTAVAMHHPRWSSSTGHGSQEQVDGLWTAAVDGGVDLSLSAHDHDYERFAPLDAAGDPADTGPAATHFVVGTGGRSHYKIGDLVTGSEFTADDVFGVLELTLDPEAFGWRFVDTDGDVLDEGDRACT